MRVYVRFSLLGTHFNNFLLTTTFEFEVLFYSESQVKFVERFALYLPLKILAEAVVKREDDCFYKSVSREYVCSVYYRYVKNIL